MSALETVHTASYTPAYSVCVYLSLTLSLSGLVCCYAAAVDGGAVVVKEVGNVNNAMLSSPFEKGGILCKNCGYALEWI